MGVEAVHIFRQGGAILNRGSLCSRSILIGALVFFLLPLLTGCADLYVTGYYDDQTWVLKDSYISISCEGGVFGTVFETLGITTSTGHYTMDLMDLGANPLELAYTCQVADILGDCCGEVQIIVATPVIYPVTLGCGKYNMCGCPY